jgi:manganese transport protein
LLLFIIVYPLSRKIKVGGSVKFHSEIKPLSIQRKSFEKIAIALDFDSDAERLLSFALSQGAASTEFLLIHVVESTGSKLYGNIIDDKETKEDRITLNHYVEELSSKGVKASGILGFGDRIESIVSIVEKESSQLLIMGAHRHTGFKDFIYGETVDKVRHKLSIPVLVVNI